MSSSVGWLTSVCSRRRAGAIMSRRETRGPSLQRDDMTTSQVATYMHEPRKAPMERADDA